MTFLTLVPLALLLLCRFASVSSFATAPVPCRTPKFRLASMPEHFHQPSEEPLQQQESDEASAQGQAHTRFCKFAPSDQTLSASDFRSQLKENMKKELERRRREDPNRGNQPAKSYLDSL